jgi:hypothetical protein
MERVSKIDRPCEQSDKVKRQDTVANLKLLQDMFKCMFENFEKKISENYQKIIRKCWIRK